MTDYECHGTSAARYFKEHFAEYDFAPEDITSSPVKYEEWGIAPGHPGVYFLFLGGKLQYIGKAYDIAKRLRDHYRSEKIRFDGFLCIETPCSHVAEYVEGYFMAMMKPPENTRPPVLSEFSYKKLREKGYEC